MLFDAVCRPTITAEYLRGLLSEFVQRSSSFLSLISVCVWSRALASTPAPPRPLPARQLLSARRSLLCNWSCEQLASDVQRYGKSGVQTQSVDSVLLLINRWRHCSQRVVKSVVLLSLIITVLLYKDALSGPKCKPWNLYAVDCVSSSNKSAQSILGRGSRRCSTHTP